jgi:hypothetical protein
MKGFSNAILESYSNIINRYKDIALSDADVLKLVGNKARIVLYPDLHKINDLDEILEPYGAAFILYEVKPSYGHWCCIIKIDDNTIEFFDPYGMYPDTELEFIPMHFRKKSHQYIPHLSWLMYNSHYNLSYNEHKFQKHSSDIKTCGRWCAIRITFKHLSLENFTKIFKKANADDIVTVITMWVN